MSYPYCVAAFERRSTYLLWKTKAHNKYYLNYLTFKPKFFNHFYLTVNDTYFLTSIDK